MRGHRTHRTLVWTLTLSAVALGSLAHAQSLTWDVNGAAAGTGNSATLVVSPANLEFAKKNLAELEPKWEAANGMRPRP